MSGKTDAGDTIMKTEQIESFSPEDTFAFGEQIGRQAVPGQVYTLIGDLGVGKTVFTQGEIGRAHV